MNALSTFLPTKTGLSENSRFFRNFNQCKLLLLVGLKDK